MIEAVKTGLLRLLTGKQKNLIKKIYFYATKTLYTRKKIKGKGNRIISNGAYLKDVVFDISGDDNLINIHNGVRLTNTRFYVFGSGNQVIIFKDAIIDGVHFVFEDANCKITVGEKTVIYNNTHIAAAEPGLAIQIGDNCLFSAYVDIRTTDSHSIIDLHSQKRINHGRNITIGNHVWLGTHVTVLKGVTIGDNSVVGIKSLVTENIPTNCVAAGIPARVIRENITWKPERIY